MNFYDGIHSRSLRNYYDKYLDRTKESLIEKVNTVDRSIEDLAEAKDRIIKSPVLTHLENEFHVERLEIPIFSNLKVRRDIYNLVLSELLRTRFMLILVLTGRERYFEYKKFQKDLQRTSRGLKPFYS